MICPDNANNDFDDLECRDCKKYRQCYNKWHNNFSYKKEEPIGDNFPKTNNDLPSFINNGICKKDNMTYCNLGYACDGCPYNKDKHPNLNKDGSPRTFKVDFITKEEVDKFKIELGEIIFYSDWEKKINESL